MKERLFQIGICLLFTAFCLYSYLEVQMKTTQLKIALPEREKEVQLLLEENKRLSYEIEQFESPSHLIELAHLPEFRHLKHPLLQEILTVPEALASNETP